MLDRKRMLCALLGFILVFPMVQFLGPFDGAIPSDNSEYQSIDFRQLEQEFASSIPMVVSFGESLDQAIETGLKSLGISFAFDDMAGSRIGPYYLLRGSRDAYASMLDLFDVSYIAPQTSTRFTQSTRDLSISEINASLVWETIDEFDRNVTGQNILIADLDSGIDWTHPEFWFANGSQYDWGELLPDAVPSNGSDFIDLNYSGTGSVNETLRIIDLDDDGNFNVSTDWIWVENITQDGIPNIGEPFFVVEDMNDNDLLDTGEKLVMLNKPKTKYIVEADGTPSRNIRSWVRDVNLTTSTHEDTDGHGTAVSGILLGGQVGYRNYVGVAPDAELMMIKVLGDSNDWLTIEEGLTWAFNHEADVILIEVGSWTYQYLDGSSATETLIESIVAAGVPVIAPSGNLGGKDKHALFDAAADTQHQVDFHVPSDDPHIEDVYITILSVNGTDFATCNFSVIINFMAWGGGLQTIYLHPGSGYYNFNPEPPVIIGPNTLMVESFISTSSRSTKMLGIHIYSPTVGIPNTSPPNGPPYHQVNVSSPQATTFHCYISDDKTSWTGGAVWMTDVSDAYEITWPSTADSAVSVASYRIRDLVAAETIGDIASFSSRGPRIDEVMKQGIAAPGGYDIITTFSNESEWSNWYNAYGVLDFSDRYASYQLFSGTSASGPHVAGCAALMLQTNTTCGSSVGNTIKNTAIHDSFTSTTPNPTWGFGKLDVYAAVEAVNPIMESIGPAIGVPERSQALTGIPVMVNVSVSDPSGVSLVTLQYHNGSSWNNITMSYLNGFYTATIPGLQNGTVVIFRIIANDTLGNLAVSSDYTYTVQDPSTTTTSTTTSGTTTETGTTSGTTTGTTDSGSTTTPISPNYLNIAIMLGLALAIIVLGCIISRRRNE